MIGKRKLYKNGTEKMLMFDNVVQVNVNTKCKSKILHSNVEGRSRTLVTAHLLADSSRLWGASPDGRHEITSLQHPYTHRAVSFTRL